MLQSDNGSKRFPASLAICCGFAALAGASVYFSPAVMIAALVCAVAIPGVCKYPELLPLAYLALTSTLIQYTEAPHIPIGVGTLYVTDLLLSIPVGIVFVRLATRPDFKIVRTPLDLPLTLFWGASIASTLIAILASSLPFKRSLGDVRIVTGYLLFFVVTNLVREKAQLKRLIGGFLFLATLVALLTIIQQLFAGSIVFSAFRVENVEGGAVLSGIARIIPPGQSMMMTGLVAVFAAMVFEKAGVYRFIQLGLLALGLLISFERASWVTTGLALLTIGLMAGKRERKRLVATSLGIGLLATVLTLAALSRPQSHGAEMYRAVTGRLSTLFENKTYEAPDSSLRWRDFEYDYALPRIVSDPFVGIGMGAYYRPWTIGKDWEKEDDRSFIHNGHIAILIKAGIFGYIGLIWFMVGFGLRGLRNWRSIADPCIRGIVLAFALMAPAVLIVSIVEPYLLEMRWAPVLGVIAAITEISPRLFSGEPSAPRQ